MPGFLGIVCFITFMFLFGVFGQRIQPRVGCSEKADREATRESPLFSSASSEISHTRVYLGWLHD
jgi:hypothetical protein